MRSRLSLVADRELPEHLIADTELALRHVGWLGVRRRASARGSIHALHLEGHVPPVALAHAGHDHSGMLADLCRGWVALDVACALVEGEPVATDGDPALAAVDVVLGLWPDRAAGGFHADLAARLARLEALPDEALSSAVAGLPPSALAFVSAAGGPRDAVHVAGILLGLSGV